MKKRQKLLAMALCGALMLTIVPIGLATSATEEQSPIMQAFSKTSIANSEVEFSPNDFLGRIQPDYTLQGIVIATLPDSTCGVLKFGSRELMTGEAITAEALGALKFVPAGTGAMSTHFTFLPVFNEEAPYESVTVGINLMGKDNRAPLAANFDVVTCKNVAITGMFKGSDPDGDPLTYKIIGKPKRGEVEILSDGTFKYTPYENKTGSDSLTYTATDSFGSISNEGKVTIKIEKAPSRVTYSDMEDDPAHYSALKLAEKGVFVGEKLGDSYYFNPDTIVSRGEFMTMLITATGAYDATPVSRTGFADDVEIADWLKPYASYALKNGIISGVSTADGRKALLPDREITRAEAAVMVNNTYSPANVGIVPVFADSEAVPVWASQAVTNLDAIGVLNSYPDGSVKPEETLTRGEAAIIVNNAIKFAETRDGKQGLLSRAFG